MKYRWKKLCSLVLAFSLLASFAGPAPIPAAAKGENYGEIVYFDSDMAELAMDGLDALDITLDEAAFRDYLFRNFAQCEKIIDLRSFNIPYSAENAAALRAYIFYDMVEAYHVYSYNISYTTSYITRITVTYVIHETAEEFAAGYAECQRTAEILLSGLRTDSLTDLEKALILHDRIAEWCEYDYQNYLNDTVPRSSYCIYGVLGLGVSVCAGIARTYMYLLRQLGIECVLCASSTLDHEWNIVTINGKQYHVDITWDDPVWDIYGQVQHVNFMRSTAGIRATGHTADDFNTAPTDTTYDNYFWQNSETSFKLFNGKIYYFDSAAKTMCSLTNLSSATLFTVSDLWKPDANHYDPSSYVRLSCDDNYLYYSTPDSIYRYHPVTGVNEVVYTPTRPGSYYWIYGFKAQGNYFYLDINNYPIMYADTRSSYGIKYRYAEDVVVPQTHLVQYDYATNGGTAATASSAAVYENDAVDLTPTATKQYWTFVGWSTDPNSTTPVTSLQMGTSDITLYAIFSRVLSASFLDYNGAATAVRTLQQTVYNKQTQATFTLPPQHTRTGWVSRGWTNQTAANAAPIAGTTVVIAENTTYYGLYQRTLSLSFDVLGGSNAPAPVTGIQYGTALGGCTVDPTVVIPNTIPFKENGTFAGWSATPNGSGVGYSAGQSVTLKNNLTLYAHWCELLQLKPNCGLTVDTENKLLSGESFLTMKPQSLADCFTNTTVVVHTQYTDRIATGDRIELLGTDGTVQDQLTVVIYGDVNSDGHADGQDAVLVNCIMQQLLSKEAIGAAAYAAAECSHDGTIDQADVELLCSAGLHGSTVPQA